MTETKATIFPADERGLNETAWFRSRHTFPTGAARHSQCQPFGNLYVLNDDALDGGRSLQMQVEEDSCVVLLPVTGNLAFRVSDGAVGLLAASQAQFLPMRKGALLELSNPLADIPVNFIQAWFRNPGESLPAPALADFDLNVFQNSLVRISPQRWGRDPLPFSVSIGKFSGRGETVYYPASPDAGVFMLVLDGAVEAEGRLLRARDGLALYEARELELASLSQGAIILLVEQPALSL